MSIDADFAYCREVIRTHSHSFYRAFASLPPAKANAVFAVYAFCRAADDTVDEHQDSKALAELEQKLIRFLSGSPPDEPMWRALQWVFANFAMHPAPFVAQIQGQRSDLAFAQPQTSDELDHYCYLVAGSVGEMLLPILATRHGAQIRDSAVNLGKAMQLTNILRDIGHDLALGRVYLPVADMDRHGLTRRDLEQKLIDSRFIAMWEDMAQRAETLYASATKNFHLYDRDSLFKVVVAKNLYSRILTVIRRHRYDCLNRRNFVSDAEKTLVIAKSALDAALYLRRS